VRRRTGYYDKLARWAELEDAGRANGKAHTPAELAQLERDLAPGVIRDYLAARQRDRQIDLAA
jgi:hypothetical protein